MPNRIRFSTDLGKDQLIVDNVFMKAKSGRLLVHEFDASLSKDLDWDQRYWFKRIFDKPDLLAQMGVRKSLNPTLSFCEKVAFYINGQCPNSSAISAVSIRRIFESRKSLLSFSFSEPFQKYSFFAQAIPDEWMTFMNYGFHDLSYESKPLRLVGAEKNWRFAAQLYHLVASQDDIRGKEVLEIGAGRGGGAAFLARDAKCKSYVATDGTYSNILFCQKTHSGPNLQFSHCRAESLPFTGQSFDVVLNVESILYYRPISAFLDEVHRVLRPRGTFLIAFYGSFDRVFKVRSQIIASGFRAVRERNISIGAALALEVFKTGEPARIIASNPLIRAEPLYRDFLNAAYDVNLENYFSFVFQKM